MDIACTYRLAVAGAVEGYHSNLEEILLPSHLSCYLSYGSEIAGGDAGCLGCTGYMVRD